MKPVMKPLFLMKRLPRAIVGEITLIGGVGDRQDKQLCIMSAAAWIAGEEHGDAPECADPLIRRLGIQLNDGGWWTGNEERTRHLMPLAFRVVGTRTDDPDLRRRRSQIAGHRAMTVFLPKALRAAAEHLERRGVLPAQAKKLRDHAAKLETATLECYPLDAHTKEMERAGGLLNEIWRGELWFDDGPIYVASQVCHHSLGAMGETSMGGVGSHVAAAAAHIADREVRQELKRLIEDLVDTKV